MPMLVIWKQEKKPKGKFGLVKLLSMLVQHLLSLATSPHHVNVYMWELLHCY